MHAPGCGRGGSWTLQLGVGMLLEELCLFALWTQLPTWEEPLLLRPSLMLVSVPGRRAQVGEQLQPGAGMLLNFADQDAKNVAAYAQVASSREPAGSSRLAAPAELPGLSPAKPADMMPVLGVRAGKVTYPTGNPKFAVMQAFPAAFSAEEADPFLMCDEFGPMVSPGPVSDPDEFPVDWHPHRYALRAPRTGNIFTQPRLFSLFSLS
jgi:hypothetical protein